MKHLIEIEFQISYTHREVYSFSKIEPNKDPVPDGKVFVYQFDGKRWIESDKDTPKSFPKDYEAAVIRYKSRKGVEAARMEKIELQKSGFKCIGIPNFLIQGGVGGAVGLHNDFRVQRDGNEFAKCMVLQGASALVPYLEVTDVHQAENGDGAVSKPLGLDRVDLKSSFYTTLPIGISGPKNRHPRYEDVPSRQICFSRSYQSTVHSADPFLRGFDGKLTVFQYFDNLTWYIAVLIKVPKNNLENGLKAFTEGLRLENRDHFPFLPSILNVTPRKAIQSGGVVLTYEVKPKNEGRWIIVPRVDLTLAHLAEVRPGQTENFTVKIPSLPYYGKADGKKGGANNMVMGNIPAKGSKLFDCQVNPAETKRYSVSFEFGQISYLEDFSGPSRIGSIECWFSNSKDTQTVKEGGSVIHVAFEEQALNAGSSQNLSRMALAEVQFTEYSLRNFVLPIFTALPGGVSTRRENIELSKSPDQGGLLINLTKPDEQSKLPGGRLIVSDYQWQTPEDDCPAGLETKEKQKRPYPLNDGEPLGTGMTLSLRCNPEPIPKARVNRKKIELLMVDREPFFVGLVRLPLFHNFDFNVQTGGKLGELAYWTSRGPFRGWQIRAAAGDVEIIFPPQGIGEEMEKGRSADGYADIEPGKLVKYRYSPPARIVVNTNDLPRNYGVAPWNIRHLLSDPRTNFDVGLRLKGASFEMLYGLNIQIGQVEHLRIAELFARMGYPRRNLAEIPRDDEMQRLQGLERAGENEFRKDFEMYRDRIIDLLAQMDSRLGVYEVFDSRQKDFDANGRPKGFELSGDIRDENSKIHAFLRYPARQKDPDQGPSLPDSFPDHLRASFEGPGQLGQRLAGSFAWAFESENIYRALWENDADKSTRDTIDANAVEVARIFFSALGGTGFQKAYFDNRRTIIAAQVDHGRVSELRVERIGRVGVYWNKAKLVTIFRRTVTPTRQFEFQQDHHVGRPILRKVAEYVEFIEKFRPFPDVQTRLTNPRMSSHVTGFSCLENVLVDSRWGQDIFHEGKPLGFKVPFRIPSARTEVYGPANVLLHFQGDSNAPESDVTGRIANLENLYFWTDTRSDKDDNTDTWEAIEGIDFELRRAPLEKETRANLPVFGSPAVPKGAGRFTFRVLGMKEKANLVSHLPYKDVQIGSLVRNVTVHRGPKPIAEAANGAAQNPETRRQGIREELSYLTENAENVIAPSQQILERAANIAEPDLGVEVLKITIPALLENGDPLGLPTINAGKGLLEKIRPTSDAFGDLGLRENLCKKVSENAVKALALERGTNFILEKALHFRAKLEAMSFPDDLKKVEGVLHDISEIRKFLNSNALFKEIPGGVDHTFAKLSEVIAGLKRCQGFLSRNGTLPKRFTDPLFRYINQLTEQQFFKNLPQAPALLSIVDEFANASIIKQEEWAPRDPAAMHHYLAKAVEALEHFRTLTKKIQVNADAVLSSIQKSREWPATPVLGRRQIDRISQWLPIREAFHQDEGEKERQILESLFNTQKEAALAAVDYLIEKGKEEIEKLTSGLPKWVEDGCDDLLEYGKSILNQAIDELNLEKLHSSLSNSYQDATEVLQWAEENRRRVAKSVDQIERSFSEAKQSVSKLVDAPNSAMDVVRSLTDAPDAQSLVFAGMAAPEKLGKLSAQAGKELQNLGDNVDRVFGGIRTIGCVFEDGANRLGVNVTPVRAITNRTLNEAGELVEELRNKAASAEMYVDQFKDRAVAAVDELKKEAMGNLFPDFGGMKLEKILGAAGIGDEFAERVKESAKLKHGFDQQTQTAYVDFRVNKLSIGKVLTIFSLGPIAMRMRNATFDSHLRVEGGAGKEIRRQEEGQIVADWELQVGSEALVTYRQTKMHAKNGKINLDLDPSRLELNSVLQAISDVMEGYSADEDGIAYGVKPLQSPPGIHAYFRMDLELPPVQAGTFGITNLTFGMHTGVTVAIPPTSPKDGYFEIEAGLNLAKPEAPFILTIFILGGAGWINVTARYRVPFRGKSELTADLSVALGASAMLGINLGFMQGSLFVSLAIEVLGRVRKSRWEFFRFSFVLTICGRASILGIISLYVGIMLAIRYQTGGGLVGEGRLKVRVKICWCFTLKVDRSFAYRFGGGGGQTNIHIPGMSKDRLLAANSMASEDLFDFLNGDIGKRFDDAFEYAYAHEMGNIA